MKSSFMSASIECFNGHTNGFCEPTVVTETYTLRNKVAIAHLLGVLVGYHNSTPLFGVLSTLLLMV